MTRASRDDNRMSPKAPGNAGVSALVASSADDASLLRISSRSASLRLQLFANAKPSRPGSKLVIGMRSAAVDIPSPALSLAGFSSASGRSEFVIVTHQRVVFGLHGLDRLAYAQLEGLELVAGDVLAG